MTKALENTRASMEEHTVRDANGDAEVCAQIEKQFAAVLALNPRAALTIVRLKSGVLRVLAAGDPDDLLALCALAPEAALGTARGMFPSVEGRHNG
jgi:hypothetical protein